MDTFLTNLKGDLSPDATIVRNGEDGYTELLGRWTLFDKKSPAAVVLPANEQDATLIVKAASAHRIPFVPATGGHSQWSTIDNKGFVVDLRRFRAIEVDSARKTVKVQGGVLMKELQLALSKEGFFTAVANGNTVGVIPYAVGGGISSYGPLVGYACENTVAAKIVSADGKIIRASEKENSDVLWAIRGAGQFLGLVTEVVLRIYEDTIIGPDGIRQLGTLTFPTSKVEEVCNVLSEVVEADEHASAGHFMILNDPSGVAGQIAMVCPQFFGSLEEAKATFEPMVKLGPLTENWTSSSFESHSDHLDYICAEGDYKHFSQTGLGSISPERFAKLVDLYREMVEMFPDANRSAFTLEWHTPTLSNISIGTETSFGCKDVEIWLNILLWYTDDSLQSSMLGFDRKAKETMRSDILSEAYVAYTNTSREDPIEERYSSPETVKRLRVLKSNLDPDGVFTREFL